MVSIANVRIACDGTHFDGPFNRLDGRKITIWRSCDLRLELAVFDRGILQNIGNLSTITVQVKPMGPNDSAPLSSTAPVMAKTVTAETFDETLTLEEWENGAGQHVVVEFSGEETDMEAGDAWLVIWATTVDNPAKILILSAGRIAVHESSGGIVTSIPDGPLENFYDRTTCDILFVRREKNLSDITSPDAARDNLGIGEVAAADLLNENDMASDSTEAAPTQHSVKAFVESIASETSATLLEEIGSATGSASVKEKYESNSDTNAYTDSDKTIVGTVGNVANLTTTTKTSTVAAINEIVSDLADYVPKTRTINGKALSSNITLINADIGSEPSIAAGTTSQYWRGDKTWVNFPAPSPSGGSVQDFWPANGFGRFSSYVLHPRFSSTGGICGPDGWMLFSENGSEAHKDYFESSTTFGSGRFGDLVFSRNIETAGDSPYHFNRPFSLEETLPLSSNSVTLSFDIKFGAGFPLGQTPHGLVICVTATTSSSGSITVDNTGAWSESNVTLATFNEITTGSTSDYERHNFTFNIPSAVKRICICIKHTPITTSADYSFYMGPMTIAIGNDYAQPMAKPYGEDYIANCRRFFSAGSTYFGQTYNGTKVTIYNTFPIAMEEVPICIRAVDNDAPVGLPAAQISDVVKCGKEGCVIRRTGNSAVANGGWSSTYYFACLQWTFNNPFGAYAS